MAGDLPDYASAVNSPTVHLVDVSVPAGQLLRTWVQPPAGTLGLVLVPTGSGFQPQGPLTFSQVILSQLTRTRIDSWPAGGVVSPTTPLFVPLALDPATEPNVGVDATETGGIRAGNYSIYALLAPLIPAVSPNVPLPVAIAGALSSGQLAVRIAAPLGQALMAASLPVALASDQPAVPVAPLGDALTVAVTNALGAGADTTIIAGVAGKSIRVLSLNLAPDAAVAGGQLLVKDGTGGVTIGVVPFSQVPPNPQDWAGSTAGRKLTTGNPLVLNSSSAANWRGTITYTQS